MMASRRICSLVGLILICMTAAVASVTGNAQPAAAPDAYLTWTAKLAEAAGRAGRKTGRVGGFWDDRGLKTERAYSYKLAATWFTPDVIRATARLVQLRSHLSDEQTRALVTEAESVGTVVMVEIDPREGSGVIPNDWEAFLRAKGRPDTSVAGTNAPRLRDIKALAGVLRRNYDYDRYWVIFPATTTNHYLQSGVLELVVRIYDKEGRVEWPVPASARIPSS